MILTCPNDTNGDGDCGSRFCPYCSRHPQLVARRDSLRLRIRCAHCSASANFARGHGPCCLIPFAPDDRVGWSGHAAHLDPMTVVAIEEGGLIRTRGRSGLEYLAAVRELVALP